MNAAAVERVAAVFISLYVLGGLGTWSHARRVAPMAASALWGKFAVNIAISAAVIAAIILDGALVAAVGIALASIGGWEVARLPASAKARALALSLFAIIACAFVAFLLTTPPVHQLLVYGVVVAFDGFSQVAGQLFGRTPLAPRISPRKTVEGVAGGAAAAVSCFALLAGDPLTPGSIGAVLALIAAALGGDLLASAWKRRASVKDYGTLLPYHGGVLDRFDGFLLAGAAGLVLARAGRVLS